ncbi:MAG: Hsp33 family molecular chaperone HslO, partial [Candidatus Eisenbacteria sp.]|nr:Hsp33 family molecular chaperone HslO [Candidatus Eisenbacteria bacterium]
EEPDGLAFVMMKQGLASAGLHLTCRPRDENAAWTLNLSEPPLNIFITADAGEGKVVGRHFTEQVKTVDHSRLFVQTVRRTGEPHLSSIPVKGFDLLGIFEQYYEQSEQATARFFELGSDEFMMLMALPEVDDPWLKAISKEESLRLLDDPEVQLIETRPVIFGCTCNRERIVGVLRAMFQGKEDELFCGKPETEARCPRCGRAYSISCADLV